MHCACISTKEAAASASKTVKCVHTTMKERQKAGGEEGGGWSGCDAITAQTHCFISEDKGNLE